MNYESLNDNVMLVELSKEEMNQFHITYDSLDCDNELTEIAIRKILNEISQDKIKTNNKITVEALPTDDGGCFFIFTFSVKPHRYKVKKTDNDFFFKTDNINSVLDTILSVQRRSDVKTPCKIFEMNNDFYLQLSPKHKRFYPIFKEYGLVSNSFSKEIINEHGKLLGEIAF